MGSRFSWAAAAFGLALVTALWVFDAGPDQMSCQIGGACEYRIANPVMAFEMVRSRAQLADVVSPDPASQPVRDAFDESARRDFLFMGAYSLFMVAMLWALAGRPGWAWMLPFCFLGVIAVAADGFENRTLMALTAAPPDPIPAIGRLITLTWIKWGAIAAFSGLCGIAIALRRKPIWVRIFALPCLAAPVVTALAYVHPEPWADLMGNSVVLVWLTLFFYSLIQMWLERRTAGETPPA